MGPCTRSLLGFFSVIVFGFGVCDGLIEGDDHSEIQTFGRTSPLNSEEAISIGTAFRIHSISDINAVKTQFSVDCTVQFYWELDSQTWNYTKVVMRKNGIDPIDLYRLGNVPANKMSLFWLPDPYFQEATEVTLPSADTPNKSFSIANFESAPEIEGSAVCTLKIKQRLIVKCSMSFRDFPFDSQTCFLNLRSFSYPKEDLKLTAADEMYVDEFFVSEQGPYLLESAVEVAIDCEYTNPPTGAEYAGVCVRFTFTRQIFYQFLSSYLPSILLVLASFAPYFMSVESTPERLNVSITLLQAIITVFAQSRKASIPALSYATRMDMYIYACIYFVIVSIAQSIIVNVLVSKNKRRLLERLEETPLLKTRTPVDINDVHLRTKERFAEFQLRKMRSRRGHDSTSSAGICDSLRGLWRRMINTDPVSFDRLSGRIIPFAFVGYNIYYWVETSKLKK